MSIADRVRESHETELERLGSSKATLALAGLELDTEDVLRAAAESEATAAETFEAWREAEADVDARAVWERAADQEREHRERVEEALGEAVEPSVDGLHEYLRGLDSTAERVGGCIGRCLVAERTLLQLVNFFVNEADEERADLFRELRADTENEVAWSESLAETVDEEEAVAAAEEAVARSYDAYAEALDEMGLDPAPLC